MHAAISHSYAVVLAGKFQKRLFTCGREQVRMPVYYWQVIAWVAKVFGMN